MPNPQQNREGSDPQQNTAAQQRGPEPTDTGVASPYGKGNIIDHGNRFHVPGSPTENEEVYKFVNGRTFNAIEIKATVEAEKLGVEGPRYMFRKGTKPPGQDRYDYRDGVPYDAEARLTQKGLKVFIPEKLGQNQDRANARGPALERETGVVSMYGPIYDAGNKYLVGPKKLAVYKEKRGREFTAEEIAKIVDAVGQGFPLPIFSFQSERGKTYDKAVSIDLRDGAMYLEDTMGRERFRDGARGFSQEEGGRPDRGTAEPGPVNVVPQPEPTAADFDGDSQGDEFEDIPDAIQETAAAARGSSRGRR